MPCQRRLLLCTLPALLWQPSALIAEPLPALRLVTGDLPPLAIPAEPGQPRGVLVDLTETLLKRAGMPVQTEFFPWARAMLVASEKPRILIIPLTRTPEREARFQWLIKLYVQHFVFMTLPGKPRVDSAEQARGLRVTVLRGSPNLAQLKQRGFDEDRVYQAASVNDMHRALERGVVDALYGGELINTDTWRRSGRDVGQLQVGLTLESGDIWLAAQSGITDAELARLHEHHEAMLADGSFERAFKRYGIRVRPEDLR